MGIESEELPEAPLLSSRTRTIIGGILFFTVGWPFALVYVLFARWLGFEEERREKRVAKTALRTCPSCQRQVSTATRICPRCEYHFPDPSAGP